MTDHANELRRYARKIGYPAGDVPSVMLAAADEIERLQARVDAAEKSDAESLAMYRRTRDEREALRAALRHEADCVEAAKAKIKALRARIEEMEKQESVATVIKEGDSRYWMSERLWTFPDGKYPIYALPGAQTQGEEK